MNNEDDDDPCCADHERSELILARMFVVMALDDLFDNCEALAIAWNGIAPAQRRLLIDSAIRNAVLSFSEDVVDAIERRMVNKGVV
jgi:hypothetical protein